MRHGRRLVAAMVAMVALASCTNDRMSRPVAKPTTTGAQPRDYANAVDGISATWPEGWHRAAMPLDGSRLSGSVELIALSTLEAATAGQCSPVPDAAMAAMGQDDALFVLRTNEWGPAEPTTPSRPQTLLDIAQPDPDSVAARRMTGDTCYPQGVEAWRLSFQEHGRPYDVFVAARSPMTEQRKAQVEEIWRSLRLTPITIGRDGADVGRTYWHVLSTHCGIEFTTFDGREWVAEPKLSDGGGNPPRGWNNPEEPGTMKMTDDRSAVFTSRDGQRSATFRPRTAPDPPASPCQ